MKNQSMYSSAENQTALFSDLEATKYDLSLMVTQVDIDRFLEIMDCWHKRMPEISHAVQVASSVFIGSRLRTIEAIISGYTADYCREVRARYQIEPTTAIHEVRTCIIRLHCAITPLSGV